MVVEGEHLLAEASKMIATTGEVQGDDGGCDLLEDDQHLDDFCVSVAVGNMLVDPIGQFRTLLADELPHPLSQVSDESRDAELGAVDLLDEEW